MEIHEHLILILNKYKLNKLYNKFLVLSLFTTTVREAFYWLLLYFSHVLKTEPNMINKFTYILIIMLGLYTPLERLFLAAKAQLIQQIKIANSDFFNKRMTNMDKTNILTFNLVDYNNTLNSFNDNLEQYIMNIKTKYDIPVRCITLLVIGLNKNFKILLGLFILFFIIVKQLNESRMDEELGLAKQYFKYDSIIRNYMINSKNFLVNNEFNNEYITKNLSNYEKISKEIVESSHILDMRINILMFVFICIILRSRIDELTPSDFMYYFLIVYDIEFIADKVTEYYKAKVGYNKMEERLNTLYSYIPQSIITIDKPINQIIINNINNKIPKLISNKKLIFNSGDHILINGESGSGKTTLLYLLKGIIKMNTIDISPDIEIINSQTYLTLPNHKSLFSGNLYDIITNYQKEPNIDIINFALDKSRINHKLNKNEFVDVEKLSSGERIRLLITRIIYAVKTKNYSILLFDEIDENLNDDLAYEICQNIMDVFNDKIILYITHNDEVKKLFTKKIDIKNGVISQ